MSTLSGHIEHTIPVGRTFSLVRDRGIEYSASGHQKVRLLDQMRQALQSRRYISSGKGGKSLMDGLKSEQK